MSQTAAIRVIREEPAGLPRTAIRYALKELARRAGVSEEFFRTWRVDFESSGFANVVVDPATNARIRFPQADLQFWKGVRKGIFRTSTADWMQAPTENAQL